MDSSRPEVPAGVPDIIDSRDTEDFYVLDEEGNPYLKPPEIRPPSRTRGDPKVAARYQWRAGSVFSDRGDESSESESDDDFEEEFSRILSSGKLAAIPEDEEAEVLLQQKSKPKEYEKLDKDYYDVPDLSNLTITCLDSLTIDLFGTVIQHYDALAMIKPKPGMYYLDVDTMLFDENRKPVGRIYELMGLVESPIYNILFSSAEEAKKLLPVGKQLYFAPEAPEEYTKILVINQLEAKARRHRNSQDPQESDTEEEEDPEEMAYYEKLKQELAEYEKRKKKRGRSDSMTSNRSIQSNAPSQRKQPRHQPQGQLTFPSGQLPYPPYAVPGMLNTAFVRQPPRNPFALPPGAYPAANPTWYPPPPPPS
ncbi:hypothetical protein FO519_006175 [Halicephalobus sp. NKZ332]|nr:hypothetical protein FO519_006175 [Halicephalobus sp. NKZ332]